MICNSRYVWLIETSWKVFAMGIYTEDSAGLGCFVVGWMVPDIPKWLHSFETLGTSHPTAQPHKPVIQQHSHTNQSSNSTATQTSHPTAQLHKPVIQQHSHTNQSSNSTATQTSHPTAQPHEPVIQQHSHTNQSSNSTATQTSHPTAQPHKPVIQQHSYTSHKTQILSSITVRTSNLAAIYISYLWHCACCACTEQ
jgi:hypothetical protein